MQSFYCLEGTLRKPFQNYKQGYTKVLEVIMNEMFVDSTQNKSFS